VTGDADGRRANEQLTATESAPVVLLTTFTRNLADAIQSQL